MSLRDSALVLPPGYGSDMDAQLSLLCIFFSNTLYAKGTVEATNKYEVGATIPINLLAVNNIFKVSDKCVVELTSTFIGIETADDAQFTYTILIKISDKSQSYVLQLKPPCADSFISRDGTLTKMQVDLSQAPDSILWQLTTCPYPQNPGYSAGDSTFSYTPTSGSIQYLGAAGTALHVYSTTTISCYSGGTTVFAYPNGSIKPDPCLTQIVNEIGVSASFGKRTKRQTSASLGRLLRLTVQAGEIKYLVSRERYVNGTFSDVLKLTKFCQECLSADSLFYYQGYGITDSAISFPLNGEGFTLMHAMSMQFLTTDVNSNLNLNADGKGNSGLTFKNAEDFTVTSLLDYRHVIVYRRTDANMSVVLYICPVHHRRFCLSPSNKLSLMLFPVNGSQADPRPSFQDPPDASFALFSEAAAKLLSSSGPPTFGIFERKPVVAIGTPQVIFIAVNLGYADVSDTSSTGPLPFGRNYRVLSYNQSLGQFVFTTRIKADQSPFRIVRQQWSDPGSSSVYVSFQLTNSSALTTSYVGQYITRSSVTPVLYGPQDSTFGSVDVDYRLFNSECCLCSRNETDVNWIYFNGPGSNVVSLAAAPNMTLTFQETALSSNPTCQGNALTIRS